MTEAGESYEHRAIKLSLARTFKQRGWTVRHIDGEGEETDIVENNSKVGDGENKKPDVDAKDESEGRVIRGEAKVDNGDFESEHSITQYKLFSNRSLEEVKSWLFIGVPEGTKEKMKEILGRELGAESLENIGVIEY